MKNPKIIYPWYNLNIIEYPILKNYLINRALVHLKNARTLFVNFCHLNPFSNGSNIFSITILSSYLIYVFIIILLSFLAYLIIYSLIVSPLDSFIVILHLLSMRNFIISTFLPCTVRKMGDWSWRLVRFKSKKVRWSC